MYGATIGKVAILNVAATTNQAVCACTCFPGVFNRYLFLMLKAFKPYFISNSSGAAQPNFSKEKIVRTPFPLPPIAEQRRIVEKVDQLLGLCDELVARQAAQREKRQRLVGATLDRLVSTRNPAEFPTHAYRLRNHFDQLFDTPTTIPQLRQTIVNLAAHGQLVRQISDDRPATETIKRNREHHRAHWEEIQLQQFKRQGKIPRSEAWKQAYEAPAPASDDGLPSIPSTWGWERIELLGIDPLSTVQTGPFGSQLLKTEFIESGVPVIAVGNLTGLGFTTDKLYFISEEKAKDLARYDVQAGDVLFARSGATLGKVCVAPDFIQDWRMTGHILRARLNQSLILPELFVLFLWGASFVTEQVSGGIRGMTRPGFNTGLLERIVLPIPPLAEQKRIVTKVTELLSLCDALEAKLTQAESASTQLLSAAVHHLLNGAVTNV
jgi:type I restriction enzyme S subunit